MNVLMFQTSFPHLKTAPCKKTRLVFDSARCFPDHLIDPIIQERSLAEKLSMFGFHAFTEQSNGGIHCSDVGIE